MAVPARADPELRRMTISEHLDELRSRVIRSLVWLVLAFVVVLIFNEHLMRFVVSQPIAVLRDLGDADATMQYTSPTEGFATWLKLALVAAVVLASPLMARELWGFVAAGLYPHEKKYIRVFAPASYALFLGGAAFLYFAVMPTALEFLFDFGLMEGVPVENRPRVAEYVSLYIVMSLLMGLVFQLPLVMLFFMATGILPAEFFRKRRRHFIVGAVIGMAVLSPTGDAATLVLTVAPVIVLYEVGILFGRLFTGRERPESAA